MICYRIAFLIRHCNILVIILFSWYLLFYRFFVEWLMGVEIPWNVRIGEALTIFHGQALVINSEVQIGRYCIIRHSTTLGNKQNADRSYTRGPVIGDFVDIGANVCIIGDITIGNNVIIGAGSVVIKSIPDNSIAVGNPARIIQKAERHSEQNKHNK